MKASMGQASLTPHVSLDSFLHHGDENLSRHVPLEHSPLKVESREETKEIDEDLIDESSNYYIHEYEVHVKGGFEAKRVDFYEKSNM